jgi:uncharacterized protein (TIGR02246 family)
MKKIHSILIAVTCLTFLSINSGCNSATNDDSNATTETGQVITKSDMAKVKADIQALENAWAAADNARDTDGVAAFYADDAVSMTNNAPMLVGKAAIKADIAKSLAKREKGNVVAYDVMDVYGDENTVTETGKVTISDSTGKLIRTGKYMAVWEKRDGKYLCVRDISNDDEKRK